MILLLRVCRQARLGFGIAIALIVTSLECYRLVKCSEKLAYLKCPFPDQPTQEKQQPQQITENNKRSRISFDNLLVMIVLFGGLLVLAESSALAPFIYTLF